MGFDEKKKEVFGDSSETNIVHSKDKKVVNEQQEANNKDTFSREMNEDSILANDDDDIESEIDLGPLCSLMDQLEKDKDDESLRKSKEQLLGNVDVHAIGDTLDSELKIFSLAIKSPGRDDIVLQIPENGKVKGTWFTLKEGCPYNLKFTFQVSNGSENKTKGHC